MRYATVVLRKSGDVIAVNHDGNEQQVEYCNGWLDEGAAELADIVQTIELSGHYVVVLVED